MKESEIKKMSVNDRLKAMEDIWSSFLEEDSIIESPEWHQDVLSQRKRKIENGEANFISLDALRSYYND